MALFPKMSRFQVAGSAVLLAAMLSGLETTAFGQVVVYRPVVPMFAPAAGPYVANYTPSGNYAAVSAFSPPVVETYAMPVSAPPMMAPAMAAVPTTTYYAPTYAAPAATTAYYAPAATTAYYGSSAVVEAPVAVAAPVTTYYAPAAVAVPLYRRGLFGAYRPVRGAYFPAY